MNGGEIISFKRKGIAVSIGGMGGVGVRKELRGIVYRHIPHFPLPPKKN
jgi:hypothetical protein